MEPDAWDGTYGGIRWNQRSPWAEILGSVVDVESQAFRLETGVCCRCARPSTGSPSAAGGGVGCAPDPVCYPRYSVTDRLYGPLAGVSSFLGYILRPSLQTSPPRVPERLRGYRLAIPRSAPLP